MPYLTVKAFVTESKLMLHHFGAFAFAIIFLTVPAPVVAAGDEPDASGLTGSESVFVNGVPAKRAADIPGAITSPDVMINGQPVIIGCSEGAPILSPNVFVNGKPKILGCAK